MRAAETPPIEIFVTEIEAFGGAERSLVALSRWLSHHGLANRILTYEDRVGLAGYADHPIQVKSLGCTGGVRSKIASLRNHFNGKRRQERLIVSGYQPALHSTLAGARGFHCLMHDTLSLIGDPSRRSLADRLRLAVSNRIIRVGLRSGGATFVNSEFLRHESQRDFGITPQIARMGGLPPVGGFHERHIHETLNLLSVCRIEGNKRIDWMLSALASLEHTVPPLSASVDWLLRLAGKGSQMEAMRSLAASLGIGDRVQFLGFVSDDELQTLMRESHLFLMPAVQGFGIPAVEAIQSGMPVLLHRDSGVSDILLDTPWATVFDGGPEQMTPALQHAIANVLSGRQTGQPLPAISTEDEWAEQIARGCGWWPVS